MIDIFSINSFSNSRFCVQFQSDTFLARQHLRMSEFSTIRKTNE